MVNFMPRYTFDSRLGGIQGRSGRDGDEKNYLPQQGIEARSFSP